MKDFVAFEARFLTSTPKVRSAKVKRIAEFNEHIKRHHQTKCVFAPCIVDQILDREE